MTVSQLFGWVGPQHFINLALRLGADREFIIFQGQRLTRRQVLARVRALAAGLQALGVGKGARVVTLLPACPEAIYGFLLPWFLGNVNVPLNPLLGEYELRHILADSGAQVVLTTERWLGQRYPEMLARLLPSLPELRHVIVCGAREGDGRAFLALSEVMAGDKPLRPAPISMDDMLTLDYTSGTTGLPKGVVRTRGRAMALTTRAAGARMDLGALRCMLLPFAPYQTAGRIGLYIALFAGGKVVLMDRPDPAEMLCAIQDEKVTQIGASPTLLRLLLSAPGQERYDLSSLRRIAFSSESLSIDLARALHERLGCCLENLYGTSETATISWTGLEDSWEQAAATVGRPVPGARVRIVDDARQPVATGVCGEVAAQTMQMMAGYYRAPDLTAQVLDAQGWYYTGDLGYLGEDGRLRLVDRKKDLIIRGGQNVYPAEVEQYLERHPAIRRAGVVGARHPLGGERVWAYVERQPGATLTVTDVLNHCLGQIAPYKIPAEVRFVERLPTTALGKVQRFRLREMAAGEADPDRPHHEATVTDATS